jgi:hypothetical protein
MQGAIPNRIGLTNRQTLLLILIGAALWAFAAIILRIVAPMGALEGWARAFTYALLVPITLPFVWLVRAAVKLRPNQAFTGVAMATTTALLIDGVVIAYFPAIYGSTLSQVTNCTAAILWGAGIGLVLAFLMNKGDTK